MSLVMAEYFHPPVRKAAPRQHRPAPKPPQKRPVPKANAKKPAVRTALPKVKKQPPKKRRSALLLLGLFVLLLGAVGVFAGRMLYYTGEQRYMQVAERFVEAFVLSDEDTLAQCIHPDMYGRLLPRNYGEVEQCEAEAQSCEALSPEPIDGVEETVQEYYRIHVVFNVWRSGQQYTCSMDVDVANIGGEAYAVKTQALDDAALRNP